MALSPAAFLLTIRSYRTVSTDWMKVYLSLITALYKWSLTLLVQILCLVLIIIRCNTNESARCQEKEILLTQPPLIVEHRLCEQVTS